MNDFASLPWYVRYSLASLFFTVVAISNPEIPWWGDVAVFAGIFLFCLLMQVCIDGWHPDRW